LASELRGVTCHYVIAVLPDASKQSPPITPAKQVSTRLTYPGWMEGWVDLSDWVVYLSALSRQAPSNGARCWSRFETNALTIITRRRWYWTSFRRQSGYFSFKCNAHTTAVHSMSSVYPFTGVLGLACNKTRHDVRLLLPVVASTAFMKRSGDDERCQIIEKFYER